MKGGTVWQMTIPLLLTLAMLGQTSPPGGIPSVPPGRPAAPHSYWLGGNNFVQNCPNDPNRTQSIGCGGPGPKGYHLSTGGTYSYVWSDLYFGTHSIPSGKGQALSFWLFNEPAPTTAAYYTFPSTVNVHVEDEWTCPATEPARPSGEE